MWRVLQGLCGVAVFGAFMVSWLWTLTFWNRVTIHRHREEYRPATFTVTKPVYYPDHDEGGDSYWLEGTVNGQAERLVPWFSDLPRPRSLADLSVLFPPGTNLPVLHNPNATTSLIQGESLRVLHATPDLWEREDRLRRRLAPYVLVPVPATLTLYLLVWYANRRQRRLLAPPTT